MPKLFLHIGHGKTGTSYLQAVFAHNMQLLGNHGIDYPGPDRVMKAAAAGATTSGNQALFLSLLRSDPGYFATSRSLLFSGESLWGRFAEPEFAPRLAEIARQSGKSVDILLFIRDPVEFQLSRYLQSAQHGPDTPRQSSFVSDAGGRRQARQIGRVLEVRNICRTCGFDLTIVNYSRARNSLVEKAGAFLGLPQAAPLEAPVRIVNRSIGAFEVGVMRGLSRSFNGMKLPPNTNYLRRLVDATAGLKMPPPDFDKGALAAFIRAVSPAVQAANAVLPPQARYGLDYTPTPLAGMPFSDEYGSLLAKEVVRSVLTVLALNMDEAGRDVIMRFMLENGLDADLSMLRSYAKKLMRKKAYDQAIPVNRAILGIAPGPDVLFRLSTCHRMLGEFDQALAVALQLFERNPEHERNASVLVGLLLQKPDPPAARKIVARARTAGLDTARGHFLEYRIENCANDPDAARKALRAATAADPDNRRYRDLLAKA